MKTGIHTFCAECSTVLAPLPAALTEAAEELHRLGQESSTLALLPPLQELRARLRSLTEKLASQQAYLLIFGPLKSGKSTLVNALSGAYVSEVTSLPGYPCLVYVQHGATPRFALTRYNGRESVFADAVVLKDVIADSHMALAHQIRAAEKSGGHFEPSTHFPEAIRRVDVRVPMPNLSDSNTAVVDTPGLYSRMNFGYDVLTREFRNSAACAVFVVKTDNLFLEQVFVEFDQLLELFSRVFLVINVDSSKRDLQSDGELRPSAESAAPEKVVEAFTTLSMSGTLRRAHEAGRVRIHALDLMSAGSVVLSGREPDTEAARDSRRRFEAFTADLTEYLNSGEYTQEFMRDSLRQARGLCGELTELATTGEMRRLRDRQDALSLEMRIIEHRLASVDRLGRIDWPGAFEKLRAETAERSRRSTEAAIARACAETHEALESWYGTEESLKALEEQRWDPVLVHAGLAMAQEVRAFLGQAAEGPFGGARPSSETIDDLHRIGITPAALSATALAQLGPGEPLEAYLITLALDEVPVKKTVPDWLLLRRAATLRRRIFGESMELPVPPAVKQQRLPAASREALRTMITENVQLKFASFAPAEAARAVYGYVEGFCGGLQGILQHKREQFMQVRGTLQAEFRANAAVVALMRKVDEQATAADRELHRLQGPDQAAAAEPEAPIAYPPPSLVEPAPSRYSAA